MLNYQKDIQPLGGWLTKAEATFLYEAAKKVTEKQAIVEIGSWKGKSTICLGKGVGDGNQAIIYAIDPHIGSSEHQKKFKRVDTFKEFLTNIAPIAQLIRPIRKTAEDAATTFNKEIGLLFIDGAHEYKYVNLDYKLWFPKVVDDGTVAFHDTWHFPGPHLVTAKLLLFSSQIKNPRIFDTITCFNKVKKNSFADRLKNFCFFFYRLIFGAFGFINLKYKGSSLK